MNSPQYRYCPHCQSHMYLSRDRYICTNATDCGYTELTGSIRWTRAERWMVVVCLLGVLWILWRIVPALIGRF